MLCNKCHQNDAIFHSRTIINGTESEEHLCAKCVDDSKLKSFDYFIQDLFASPLDFIMPHLVDFEDFVPVNNLENTNFDRYANYKDVLDQAMDSVRIGVNSATQLTPKEIELRTKLADAVANEEYEIAGKIKKELDLLKENGKED